MQGTTDSNIIPLHTEAGFQDCLQEILRQGARTMLQAAVEAEVSDYINALKDAVDENGHRLVVRNGHHPERNILTGIGKIPVKKPKVNDKRLDENGNRHRFESQILPPYLKKTKSIEELVPWLYLRGISTGDFPQALEALLGKDAKGLSANSVVRLKRHWEADFEDWNKRDLSDSRYVYFWADGVYPRIRLDSSESQCFLVIMGATAEGKKELVAIGEGLRESEIAWLEVLRDLKSRGLKDYPKVAVGDGALGFWKAISKEFPNTKHQRCWVHKTCNVLDKLPKSSHGKAKSMLKDIYTADSKTVALNAVDLFCESFSLKHSRAVECLLKDKDELLTFYDFPAEHWCHIRTTNPIESLFATIRLRTKRTKGHGNVKAALTMAFKLAKCAEKNWRKLKGHTLLADVINVKFKFKDGIKVEVKAA